jgi:hypothetical protein
MTGPYRDENTRYSVKDLGNITPVEWLRLATPIVEGKGIATLRRSQAFEMMQEPQTPFVDFLLVLQQAFLVAGIHYGWDVMTFREKLLERLPQSLNAKCHQSYLKKYQTQHLEVEQYDEVIAALEQADAWKSVTKQLSAAKGNPYVAMIHAMEKSTPIDLEEKETPSKGTKKDAAPNGPTNGSRKALQKENDRLRARLLAAEKGKAPASSDEGASDSVNVIARIDCRFCKRSHTWPVEECYSNPNCKIPRDQRRSKGAKGPTPAAKASNKGNDSASK